MLPKPKSNTIKEEDVEMVLEQDVGAEYVNLYGKVNRVQLIELSGIELSELGQPLSSSDQTSLPFENISFEPQPIANYKLFLRYWQLEGKSKRVVLTKRRTASVEFDGKIVEIIQILLKNAKSKAASQDKEKNATTKSASSKKRQDGVDRKRAVVRIQEESLGEKERRKFEIERKYEEFEYETSRLLHKKKSGRIKSSSSATNIPSTETLESTLSSFVDNTPETTHGQLVAKENNPDFPCHVFSIMQVGKCDAKGYYNTTDGGFYILKGSLVSAEFETQLLSSPLQKTWKQFIDERCEFCSLGKRKLMAKVKKVKEDFRCDKASIAASLVLGRAANNAHWRDSDGHLLKDIYPNEFALTYQ